MISQIRDTIIVAGPSACGKTEALNNLRKIIGIEYKLPQEFTPLSDSHTILACVREDDASGGKHHYHPWMTQEERLVGGHNHANHPELTPFTLAGREIGFAFMGDFFKELMNLPHDDGLIKYAEWSGGINVNKPEDPASRTDVSFTTIARLLLDGTFPAAGLERVKGIIHVATTRDDRNQLNDQRGVPTEDDIRFGLASWQLDRTAMNIFGKDDFRNMNTMALFQRYHIPFVTTIYNDRKQSLENGLRRMLIEEHIVPWRGGETGLSRGKEL